PVSGLALSPRDPERRRSVRLQRPGGSRRITLEPARPGALGHRLSLGRVADRRRAVAREATRLAWGRNEEGDQMPEKPFAAALNEQIANEFAAQQQYIGAAVYYESQTLPRLAAFFYRQAVEERNHAMMMVQYLLDANQEVRIPDI